MTLIYYDINVPKDNLYILSQKIRETVDDAVLFVPKSFDVYLNASKEQLLSIKNTIDAALALKEN